MQLTPFSYDIFTGVQPPGRKNRKDPISKPSARLSVANRRFLKEIREIACNIIKMRLGKLRHLCTIFQAYLTKLSFQLSQLSEPRCKASCLAGAWTPVNLGAVVEKVQSDGREITPIMSWARRNNPFGGTLGRGERA